jgi:hypothetical protein
MGASLRVVCVIVFGLAAAVPVHAQTAEVGPFAGYRFGGGFYELATGRSVDVDGAPSIGVFADIPFRDALQIEAFYTHQEARFTLPPEGEAPETRWRVTVDHWQAGGLRELRPGPVRPFLTGTLGLTRYASAGDSEIRFALAAGGGVKLIPARRFAVRLDGRLYATVVDADGDALFCRVGRCVGSLDASVIWQLEFTAGAVLRF